MDLVVEDCYMYVVGDGKAFQVVVLLWLSRFEILSQELLLLMEKGASAKRDFQKHALFFLIQYNSISRNGWCRI